MTGGWRKDVVRGMSSHLVSVTLLCVTHTHTHTYRKGGIMRCGCLLAALATVHGFQQLSLKHSFEPLAATRRELLTWASVAVVLGPESAKAVADANSSNPTSTVVVDPFDKVRFELSDPQGGVAYLQSCVDKEDYAAILEFTKTYDQVLRKGGMGKAKKLLQDKETKNQATVLANSVTFDLIGMNRASRKGQENKQDAQKYLDELKQDATSFMALQGN